MTVTEQKSGFHLNRNLGNYDDIFWENTSIAHGLGGTLHCVRTTSFRRPSSVDFVIEWCNYCGYKRFERIILTFLTCFRTFWIVSEKWGHFICPRTKWLLSCVQTSHFSNDITRLSLNFRFVNVNFLMENGLVSKLASWRGIDLIQILNAICSQIKI